MIRRSRKMGGLAAVAFLLVAVTTTALASDRGPSRHDTRGQVRAHEHGQSSHERSTGHRCRDRDRSRCRCRVGRGRHNPLPQGSEEVVLNPADFTTDIDNRYWPMHPGSRWVYEENDAEGTRERVVVKVTNRTKMIANGIEARVVVDTVTEDGVPIEITKDWYAQDKCGNIWYLGEYVSNYENGRVVDHDGSFEAGVDGAQAGIAMPANPTPGLSYRQEYYEGEAEDEAAVITVGEEQVEVPFGYFNKDVLMTRDLVPTEPMVQELKFYGLDVGPLLSLHTDGPGGRGALVRYTPGK